jgi:CRP-like cAMP-binding protein
MTPGARTTPFLTPHQAAKTPKSEFNNRILASLPQEEIRRLRPHLKPINLQQGMVLMNGIHSHAYLLDKGIASVVVGLSNGLTVEVGVVGCDGIVGIPLLLGTGSTPGNTTIQIAGSGFSITAGTLKAEFERPSELRQLLLRYVHAFLVQTSQTAACNRLHTIEERLARWLLSCRDRMTSDRLALTHEFLGDMLGSPRTTVTLAMGLLERAGMIRRSRGAVTITNRPALQSAACECYRVVHDEYLRLGFFDV